MRLGLVLSCAALARALPAPQYSANEGEIATAATSAIANPVPTAGTSTTGAAVVYPSADSSWSHNGTAYFKYSLPEGVSPMSISYVLANDNDQLLKVGNSQLDQLKPYFVYKKMMREYFSRRCAA